MATVSEQTKLGVVPQAAELPLVVTEKAAAEVKRIIAEQASEEPLFLRVTLQGGGCSGFQNKLDLDSKYNEKTDESFEVHGIQVVVDKRSLIYMAGATIDFHDDLNKRGFSVTNPNAKGTCGCGSSYSM